MDSEDRPFRGLLSFNESDARVFFGRDDETSAILSRLQQNRFIAIAGGPGSGKSSLVRAGLIPELRMAHTQWRIIEIRPSLRGPKRDLDAALGSSIGQHRFGLSDYFRSRAGPILLFIDQFEDILAYRALGLEEEHDVQVFIQQLLEVSSEHRVSVSVVLTMRADCLTQCTFFHGLPEALSQGIYFIPQMSRAAREDAIRSPLRISGVDIEHSVVHTVLSKSDRNYGEISIFQHLLKRIWEEWESRGRVGRITDADLNQTGGCDNAIDQDAETVLRLLSKQQQSAVQRMFQRITSTRSGRTSLRTPCSYASLLASTRELLPERDLRNAIAAFRERDLLVWQGELDLRTVVTLSQECLTRKWKRLGRWLAH